LLADIGDHLIHLGGAEPWYRLHVAEVPMVCSHTTSDGGTERGIAVVISGIDLREM